MFPNVSNYFAQRSIAKQIMRPHNRKDPLAQLRRNCFADSNRKCWWSLPPRWHSHCCYCTRSSRWIPARLTDGWLKQGVIANCRFGRLMFHRSLFSLVITVKNTRYCHSCVIGVADVARNLRVYPSWGSLEFGGVHRFSVVCPLLTAWGSPALFFPGLGGCATTRFFVLKCWIPCQGHQVVFEGVRFQSKLH